MDTFLRKAERYVGMPYVEEEFDCADLAALVQWELFDQVVMLPAHADRPRGAMGQAREIRKYRDQVASPLDLPCTGCAVLLQQPVSPAPLWHVGTAFLDGSEVWVLHNSYSVGSTLLQRLSTMRQQGMLLEGFYAWR